MRILVCGGRNYADEKRVLSALKSVQDKRGLDCVIQGGAPGADQLAGAAGESIGVPVEVFPADWKTHGRKAGPLRNQRMLEEGRPDGVIAFPGGSGTKDMVRRARAAGLPVWEIE